MDDPEERQQQIEAAAIQRLRDADQKRDWYFHSHENDDALRRVAREACGQNRGLLKQLAGLCGYKNANSSELSDWMGSIKLPYLAPTPKTPHLRDNRYFTLIEFGFDQGWFVGNEAVLQRGLAAFLGITPQTTRGRRHPIGGHYRVHRFSFLAKGYVLVGYLHIDPVTLRTRENFRIQEGVGERTKDGWFPRSGVLLPRGEGSFVAVSKKTNQNAEVQLTYLHASADPITRLEGQIADWHGKAFYGARFVADRIDGELPRDDIRAVEARWINRGILDLLHGVVVRENVAVIVGGSE